MPGLSQLKQFNADILSLGNEPILRANRGEKPVTVPIPKDIKDVDDSKEFALGMPVISEDQIKANQKTEVVEEDFSDIMGGGNKTAATAPASTGVDLSSLVGNIQLPAEDIEEIDLSAFDEPIQEDNKEPEPEAEPEKEPEIGDLSLDALLGGAGFDGTEGVGEYIEEEPEPEPEVIPEAEPVQEMEPVPETIEAEDLASNLMGGGFDSSVLNPDLSSAKNEPANLSGDDMFIADTGEFGSLGSFDLDSSAKDDFGFDLTETDSMESPDVPETFDISDIQDITGSKSDDSSFQDPMDLMNDDFGDIGGQVIDMAEGLPEEISETDGTETADTFSNFNFDISEPAAGSESADITDFGISDSTVADEPAKTASSFDEFNLDDMDNINISGGQIDLDNINVDNINIDDILGEKGSSALSENFDLGSDFADISTDLTGEEPLPSGADLPDDSGLYGFDNITAGVEDDFYKEETGSPMPEMQNSTSAEDDFLSGYDFNLSSSDDLGGDGEDLFQESEITETFDTSEMDGMEFPETDAQLDGKSDFELGGADDFGMDPGDFEIAGFTDVQTADVSKKKAPKLPEPDFSNAAPGDKLPPNTLSDAQYKKFRKNLSGYPLNVRIAVEDLIVKNEFTDEAEFEIIQKVLKKVSARQLAAELEKMLDIPIPVPRDFERRTAEEYEAYKKSFQYQLRNRIIPATILGVAACIIGFFLIAFVKNFIYKPAMASSLYKEGYELLQAGDYPQSEIKFVDATKYQLKKKWFFNYARAYCDHKQYIRSEQMYLNTLRCFNQDKQAGLEYAAMEMNELANYEKAEQILLREVLDYHINDKDGVLLLGDNYLEWATEKDPSKFDEAYNRYMMLIQAYGDKEPYLYNSRLMRYFVRTDKLKEVLEIKPVFMPKAKSLGASDWTEMSGFLLDKLYGQLAPSEEYLRSKIEDLKECLTRAVKADPTNPIALYNFSRYYINTNNKEYAKAYLRSSIDAFDKASTMKKRDMYKYIDSYRLLGEIYTGEREYLRSRELYTNGLSLYISEHEGAGLEGTKQIGELYADLGDLDYFISGDMDSALYNYKEAVDTENDNGILRYKIGYIQYSKKNFAEAVGSFMKATEEYSEDKNLLLAMGNTLSLKKDDYAAQGYYERLLERLDAEKETKQLLMPQVRRDEAEIVNSYLYATNNLGVTMYRLARRTGSSAMNAKSMVMFQDSMRAWDALTRNQTTMVRLGGSNLAEQNMKYVSHPMPEYEPSIYTDISRTLTVEKGLAE